MTNVEIFNADDVLMMRADLPFVPRVGEYMSIEDHGIFTYFNVTEVWIRKSAEEPFKACIRVVLDD